jgi:2-octaprenyl-6-methoxyphenol hydroxylase
MEKDLIIVGSGPIALAAALFFKDLKIALVINHRPSELITSPVRLFSLARESYNLLVKAGLLDQILEEAQPINQIRVVDNNSYSKLDFFPATIGLENFGFFLEESYLARKLFQKLEELKIEIIQSEDYILNLRSNCAELIMGDKKISAPLIVVADGKASPMRKKLGITTKEFDYKETAIILDIAHKTWPHRGIAVEKFTPSGPFAILPKYQGHGTESSLVWIEKTPLEQADFASLTREQLHQLVAQKLDGYLNPFELISDVKLFPLKLIQAKARYKDRIVLVGDAAQAIHPVAGQGFNLGLRDVKTLAKLVLEYKRLGLDLASALPKYSQSRNFDVELMIGFTGSVAKIFSNDLLPLKILRRGGLRLIDSLDEIKKVLIKYACGL